MGLFGIGDDQVKERGTPFPIGENVSDVFLTGVEYDGEGDYGPQLKFMLEQRVGDTTPSKLIDFRSLPILGKVYKPKDSTDSDEVLFKNAAMDLNAVVKSYCLITGKASKIETEIAQGMGASEDPEQYGQVVADVLTKYLKQPAGPCFLKTYKSDKGYARVAKYVPFIQLEADAKEPEGDLRYSAWEIKQNQKEVPTGTSDETGDDIELDDEGNDDLTEFLD
jgi:hypothetical protein